MMKALTSSETSLTRHDVTSQKIWILIQIFNLVAYVTTKHSASDSVNCFEFDDVGYMSPIILLCNEQFDRRTNSSTILSTKRIFASDISRNNILSYLVVVWQFFVNCISVAGFPSWTTWHTIYTVPRDGWGGQGLLTCVHIVPDVGISRALISPWWTCNEGRRSHILVSVIIVNQYRSQNNYLY